MNKKLIYTLLPIILVLFLGYLVISKFGSLFPPFEDIKNSIVSFFGGEPNEEKSKDEIQSKIENEYGKNSVGYSGQDFKDMADRLYNAMNGIGTDESAIYNVIEMLRNRNDWELLEYAYGKRNIDSWGGSAQDLKSSLHDDLGSGDIYYINTMLEKIGANKI